MSSERAEVQVSREDLIADAVRRGAADPRRLTIREVLHAWDFKRRESGVIDRIDRDLAAAGLRVWPPLAEGLIDGLVEIRSISEGAPVDEAPPETIIDRSLGVPDSRSRVTLRVDQLPAATGGVVSIAPSDSLSKAQSLMVRHDYSQLPVVVGRTLKGAVSWRSISIARLGDPGAGLAQATKPVGEVPFDADLLSVVARVVEEGFVLVKGRDNSVQGIITPADLSMRFVELANPFLLIGEIERILRRVIDAHFTRAELEQLRDPKGGSRPVEDANDLTFGEYQRLLERPASWDRLNWNGTDRKVFVGHLEEVRQLRNSVVHFSPDTMERSDLDTLRHFIAWLQILVPGE